MPVMLPGAYRSPYTETIARLMMRQGDIAAQGAERQGQIWGNAVSGLGQIGAQAYQQHQEQKQTQARTQAFNAAISTYDGTNARDVVKRLAMAIGPEAAVKTMASLETLDSVHRGKAPADEKTFALSIGGVAEAERKMPGYIKSHWPQLTQMFTPFGIKPDEPWNDEIPAYVQSLDAKLNAPKADAGFTLGPNQARFDASGKQIAAGPAEAPKAENPEPVVIDGRATVATPTEIAQAKAQGKTVSPYQAPPQRDPNAEPLESVMGPDGQPVYVRRSAAVGKRPASGREQGRPVISGDANRIADLDTSIKDAQTLRATLTANKSTGVSAKVGAALPNVVTEFTGWGADAKSKQATIDRVKQVIGKALEGGVLRKEDEYKYEKILPTIGDPPDLVASKLDGLEAAIRMRRENTINALEDAGFDVARYRQRSAATEKKADPLGIR